MQERWVFLIRLLADAVRTIKGWDLGVGGWLRNTSKCSPLSHSHGLWGVISWWDGNASKVVGIALAYKFCKSAVERNHTFLLLHTPKRTCMCYAHPSVMHTNALKIINAFEYHLFSAYVILYLLVLYMYVQAPQGLLNQHIIYRTAGFSFKTWETNWEGRSRWSKRERERLNVCVIERERERESESERARERESEREGGRNLARSPSIWAPVLSHLPVMVCVITLQLKCLCV